jgi:hypothetical protein
LFSCSKNRAFSFRFELVAWLGEGYYTVTLHQTAVWNLKVAYKRGAPHILLEM